MSACRCFGSLSSAALPQARSSLLSELVASLQRLSAPVRRPPDALGKQVASAATFSQQPGKQQGSTAGQQPGQAHQQQQQQLPAAVSPAVAAAAAAAHARSVAGACLTGVARGVEGVAYDAAAAAFALGAAAAVAEEEEDAARASAAAAEAAGQAARVLYLCWPALFAGFSQMIELSGDEESQASALSAPASSELQGATAVMLIPLIRGSWLLRADSEGRHLWPLLARIGGLLPPGCAFELIIVDVRCRGRQSA